MALDLSGPKTPPPPKRQSNTAAKAARASVKTEERKEAVNGIFQLASAGLLFTGNHADAGACAKHGEPIATEVANLAEENESIGRIIDYITAVGPYAGILTAVMPFAIQIMVNHKRLPAEPFVAMGVTDPETLKAELQTQMMRQQAQALKQAHEAEIEYQEWEAELRRMEAQKAASNGRGPADIPTHNIGDFASPTL